MKFECSCGTKVAFDVTPDMAQTPVEFVCPDCGLDSSDAVNQLIAQEFTTFLRPVSPSSDTSLLPEMAVAAEQQRVAAPPPQVRIPTGGGRAETASTSSRFCPKHPGQRPTHRCLVCKKPICPKCMESFGYVCSALCRNKADLQGIVVPVYAGQKSLAERRRWRRIGAAIGAIAVLAVIVVIAWVWFYWFASRPSVAFSYRFDQSASSGQSAFCPDDQIVFLHGSLLARFDTKQKKQVWSSDLVDKERIDKTAVTALRGLKSAQNKTPTDGQEAVALKTPTRDALAASIESLTEAGLQLHVSGQNVWVVLPDKLVRYNWNTGNPDQQIPIEGGYDNALERGNELLVFTTDYSGQEIVTRVNMATGETHSDQIKGKVAGQMSSSRDLVTDDAAKLAASVQRMSFAQKLALPATVSVQRNQQQALKEIKSQDQEKPAAKMSAPRYSENVSVIPTRNGLVQFSTILLEQKIVTRKAMKDAPKKSALGGEVNATQSAEVANEILNDMRRQDGGDMVEEDESRYLVTIRRPDVPEATDWRGEVVGPPALFPLNTVTVLAAGKSITVFDRLNKKLWQSTLNYRIPENMETLTQADPTTGQGPCVEHANTLYVFDEGVLSAFDLATGNAQWRLPSVGIKGIFFDDMGMIYVSSTTASPESIKYSRQIDVTSRVNSVILKIEPKTGKILWTAEPGGALSYVSGKFIYTLESLLPEEDDSPYAVSTGLDAQPFLRIKRINPSNGKVMWEHFQQRGPLDVRFDKNLIQIVFKKEIQVLKYFSM